MSAIPVATAPKPERVSKKSKAAPWQHQQTTGLAISLEVDAQESDKEANSLSDKTLSIDDIQFGAEADEGKAIFTPAQLSIMQETASSSVQAALSSLQGHKTPAQKFHWSVQPSPTKCIFSCGLS